MATLKLFLIGALTICCFLSCVDSSFPNVERFENNNHGHNEGLLRRFWDKLTEMANKFAEKITSLFGALSFFSALQPPPKVSKDIGKEGNMYEKNYEHPDKNGNILNTLNNLLEGTNKDIQHVRFKRMAMRGRRKRRRNGEEEERDGDYGEGEGGMARGDEEEYDRTGEEYEEQAAEEAARRRRKRRRRNRRRMW